MRKIIISALAATALLTATSGAFAGWFDAYGIYHPTCGWVPGFYGPVFVCN